MKMNLKSDKAGFMYFNEVIFGFYSNLYYKSKMFKEGLKNPKSQMIIDEIELASLDIIASTKI